MKTKLKAKSALSYYGSDSEVAADLAAMLDHCKHVTIPFCGGLAILPHLKARAIVANDLHEHVYNFYQVASGIWGDLPEFQEQCKKTLSHPAEIRKAREVLALAVVPLDYSDATEVAWAFWCLCWVGRKGKGGTKNQGGMPSVRRTASGGTNATRIRTAANDLEEWARQFERCEFESICFRELLPKVADGDDIGIYLDPPWRGDGDKYLHSFTEQDHRDLAELLRRFERTTIVIRYGDAEIIRKLYSGWHFVESKSRSQSGSKVKELWITNKCGEIAHV